MAGYPVHRRANASTAMVMARNVHTSIRSPGVGSDGFMNMSPVSTSERQPLARGSCCYGERTPSGRGNRTFGAYRFRAPRRRRPCVPAADRSIIPATLGYGSLLHVASTRGFSRAAALLGRARCHARRGSGRLPETHSRSTWGRACRDAGHVVGEVRRLDHPRPRAGLQVLGNVGAVLLVLVRPGGPDGVGDR